MTCDGPCFAATPTHGRPTTKRIWVKVRSARPRSLRSSAAWVWTAASALTVAMVRSDYSAVGGFMGRGSMLRLLAFVAVAALLAPAPVGAQFQKPIPANDPPPNGQRIEANDGDTIVIRGGARVRVVHRSEGTVRAIYNSGQRWLVILMDFADPNGGPPDGKVDGSYRF